jgi:hypothetical protein
MRLLPWTRDDGKPCYLSMSIEDESTSYMARLADNLEAVQLGMADDLLDYVQDCLSEEKPSGTELRSMTMHLCGALRDVVRIADSRGDRLPGLTDELEAARLGTDKDLLKHAEKCLSEEKPSETELRSTVTHLCGALRDVVLIAESRSGLLPLPADDEPAATARATIDQAFGR